MRKKKDGEEDSSKEQIKLHTRTALGFRWNKRGYKKQKGNVKGDAMTQTERKTKNEENG